MNKKQLQEWYELLSSEENDSEKWQELADAYLEAQIDDEVEKQYE